MVGTATYFVLGWLDFKIPYIYCLVFGALISPTDPVAVLAILKSAGASKSLSTKIAGESLFNDGVGVVVFMVLVGLAVGGGDISFGNVALLFVEEAIGGVVFGLGLGYIGYLLLKDIDNYSVEVLITLAMVAGGYALAMAIHTSGPIAVVVAGLLIGNHGRRLAMSDTTRKHLDVFWELIDETLNAVLFVWIGLEILVLHFELSYLWAGLIAIPVALLSRFIAVKTAVSILKTRRSFSRNAEYILTWGGLRGGISIALALSLTAGPTRDLIVSMTYVIVIFSILVQGLSIRKLVQMSAQAPE
jgi:CPA1 family monovalent cation:H+ antiporter